MRRSLDTNFTFLATTGHEIGHGRMEAFLRDGEPPPEATLTWVHFGRPTPATNGRRRHQTSAASTTSMPEDARWCRGPHSVSLKAASEGAVVVMMVKTVVGGLREVKAAGYPLFGLAGPHRLFDTPNDTLEERGLRFLSRSRAVEELVAGSTQDKR